MIDTLGDEPRSPGPLRRVSKTFDQASSIDARSRRRQPLLRAPDRRNRRCTPSLSFGVIFVAELGDKSQLMALTFAARYRALPILIGITIATAAGARCLSVLVGARCSAWPCRRERSRIVGRLAFLGFAAWTLRGDSSTTTRAPRPQPTSNRR